jgi:hypothetical protein
VKNIESICDIKLKAEGVLISLVLIHTKGALILAVRRHANGAGSPAYIKRGFVIRVGIIDEAQTNSAVETLAFDGGGLRWISRE